MLAFTMRNDNLQTFVKLRRELIQEKEQISRRLAQINEALGEMPLPSLAPAQGVAEQPESESQDRQAGQPVRSGRKPAGGGSSLRELVIEVLRGGPKTKEEVLEAVQKRGYRFQTNNPLNSLGVILYGKNPKFNRVDGRFSLPGGAGASGGAGTSGGGGGQRQMSAAARARIAEAQRKRWETARKSSGIGAGSSSQSAGQKNGSSGGGRGKISAAGRKAIAEAARRRWAAAKAAGRKTL